MKIARFHKEFKLNNNSFFSVDELLEYAKESTELSVFFKEWFSKESFVVVGTSGSTGIPKKIKLQKEQMVNSALATGEYFKIKEKATVLLCLPIAYIAGKMMLIRALTLGWHLDIVQPSTTPLKNISRLYDFTAMVPLQLENSLSKLSKIKKMIVGGGVVSRELQDKIKTSTCIIFATYGMTETITHIAVKKLNNFKENALWYTTFPNVKIYKDTKNCLVIEAPEVANEVVFTNDIVTLVSDTQFEWLGRYDNVINSGGIKLHPEKIEEKLAIIISNRFFVVGIPDKTLGEKLVLIIEGKPQKVSFENIGLLPFEKPKEIHFIDHFIETKTKKIQRRKTLCLINTKNKVE